MADLTALARPYAKAAFELAQENDTVDSWSVFLSTVEELCKVQEIADALENIFINQDEKASWFIDNCTNNNDEISRFIHLLAHNNRLSLLPVIAYMFQDCINALTSLEEVDVYTPYHLGESQLLIIKEKIAKSIGKENIKIVQHNQPDLIGGIRAQGKRWVMDASISGKMKELARSLTV